MSHNTRQNAQLQLLLESLNRAEVAFEFVTQRIRALENAYFSQHRQESDITEYAELWQRFDELQLRMDELEAQIAEMESPLGNPVGNQLL